MKKKLLYGGLSFGIIMIAFIFSSYLINAKPEPRKDNRIHNSMYVKVEKVAYAENTSNMVYRGRVTAFDKISLAAEVQGKILAGDVRFKAGENFKKGDVIVNIYSQDVEASLKSGKSSLLQTLSKILPDLKFDYPEEYQKWNAFFNEINVENPLPTLPEIGSNKEKVFLASNNVLSTYYNLQQQEINLARYTIYAPFNGTFVSVSKEIGAIASPGVELASLLRTDKLEVSVSVFPSDLQWIRKGDQVQITDHYGEVETASIARISGFINEATQTVDVYLVYQNNGNASFLQGEYVDASFKGATVSGFEIPREAIVDGTYVYELSDKKLNKIPIDILRQLNDSYIISGIEQGKTIVTESLAIVNSGVEYLAR